MYVTINNIKVNDIIYPFEIFINSKTLEHQQWIVALTRIISAIFRYSSTYNTDITFMTRELKSVFDPNGGYLKKNKRVPSLVAEIADIIEAHLLSLGTILVEPIESKTIDNLNTKYMECPDCHNYSVIKQDGCNICTICGYSKCG
jgi:ribonucleoside-diphosphate reductase alpha chain